MMERLRLDVVGGSKEAAALPDLVREVKRSVEGREGWVPGSLGMPMQVRSAKADLR